MHSIFALKEAVVIYSKNDILVHALKTIWISAMIGHKMWPDIYLTHNNR